MPNVRFFAKVEIRDDGCWLWTGGTDRGGYGVFWSDGRLVRAHRFSYERTVGSIPDGLQLDHLCRNPSCVNPAHLEPVTGRTNVLRGTGPTARNAVATRCIRGHEFTPANTYRFRDGRRRCRRCHRERERVAYVRRRQSAVSA